VSPRFFASLGRPERLVVAFVVVVITVPASTIMVPPMAVVVVLAVPMPFVQLPAFTIMVVMRMGPVGPFERRTLPTSVHPPVMATSRLPVPLYPNEAGARRWTSLFINDSWWWRADIHRDTCAELGEVITAASMVP